MCVHLSSLVCSCSGRRPLHAHATLSPGDDTAGALDGGKGYEVGRVGREGDEVSRVIQRLAEKQAHFTCYCIHMCM